MYKQLIDTYNKLRKTVHLNNTAFYMFAVLCIVQINNKKLVTKLLLIETFIS